MREFIVDLTRTLARGLRAFDPSNRGSDLMLDECHNLAVGEAGLETFRASKPTGWKSAYFNYLPIFAQDGTLFWWYPVYDGHILVDTNIPSEPTTGLDAIPISDPVQWIEILDENLMIWKLYPNDGDGLIRATDQTPLNGVAIQNMIWRGTTGENWIIQFNAAELYYYNQRVF